MARDSTPDPRRRCAAEHIVPRNVPRSFQACTPVKRASSRAYSCSPENCRVDGRLQRTLTSRRRRDPQDGFTVRLLCVLRASPHICGGNAQERKPRRGPGTSRC